jgi:hypothetical protein
VWFKDEGIQVRRKRRVMQRGKEIAQGWWKRKKEGGDACSDLGEKGKGRKRLQML